MKRFVVEVLRYVTFFFICCYNLNMKRIVISGGFDPIHPGHIAMIEDAKK